MTKIISKFGIASVCLIAFILLCGVFASENAFSGREWTKLDMVVTYDQEDNSINFKYLVYDYCILNNEYGYLKWCEFFYCEEGNNERIPLMLTILRAQKVIDCVSILMKYKKNGEVITLFSRDKANGIKWTDCREFWIKQELRRSNFIVGQEASYIGEMRAKWTLPRVGKPIKSILVVGLWSGNDKSLANNIHEIYPVETVKSNSSAMADSLVLKPEITKQVKVTGETDAINVTGAEPGKEIKVYTVSGVVVKSVVATDDVVNIKLPTNQIYIVKAGPERCKVAL